MHCGNSGSSTSSHCRDPGSPARWPRGCCHGGTGGAGPLASALRICSAEYLKPISCHKTGTTGGLRGSSHTPSYTAGELPFAQLDVGEFPKTAHALPMSAWPAMQTSAAPMPSVHWPLPSPLPMPQVLGCVALEPSPQLPVDPTEFKFWRAGFVYFMPLLLFSLPQAYPRPMEVSRGARYVVAGSTSSMCASTNATKSVRRYRTRARAARGCHAIAGRFRA